MPCVDITAGELGPVFWNVALGGAMVFCAGGVFLVFRRFVCKVDVSIVIRCSNLDFRAPFFASIATQAPAPSPFAAYRIVSLQMIACMRAEFKPVDRPRANRS
jgi:hypothetical protein